MFNMRHVKIARIYFHYTSKPFNVECFGVRLALQSKTFQAKVTKENYCQTLSITLRGYELLFFCHFFIKKSFLLLQPSLIS